MLRTAVAKALLAQTVSTASWLVFVIEPVDVPLQWAYRFSVTALIFLTPSAMNQMVPMTVWVEKRQPDKRQPVWLTILSALWMLVVGPDGPSGRSRPPRPRPR